MNVCFGSACSTFELHMGSRAVADSTLNRVGGNSQSCACCINLDLCAFDKLSNFNECKPLAKNTRKNAHVRIDAVARVGLMQFSVLEK